MNRQFAAAVIDEVRGGRRRRPAGGSDALVLLHDYQLYLVAPDVRAACPGAFLHQFIHIPWPQSDYWRVLPTQIREAVFRGLLGNDVVAFHTRHYVQQLPALLRRPAGPRGRRGARRWCATTAARCGCAPTR